MHKWEFATDLWMIKMNRTQGRILLVNPRVNSIVHLYSLMLMYTYIHYQPVLRCTFSQTPFTLLRALQCVFVYEAVGILPFGVFLSAKLLKNENLRITTGLEKRKDDWSFHCLLLTWVRVKPNYLDIFVYRIINKKMQKFKVYAQSKFLSLYYLD